MVRITGYFCQVGGWRAEEAAAHEIRTFCKKPAIGQPLWPRGAASDRKYRNMCGLGKSATKDYILRKKSQMEC